MFKSLCMLLLLCSSLAATQIDAKFVLPDTKGFNGTLNISLAYPLSRVTPVCIAAYGSAIVIPTVTAMVTIVNGAMTSHPNFYPNDCLLPQQPYIATLTNTAGVMRSTDYWWLGNIGGVLLAPITGNKKMYSPGIYLLGSSATPTIYKYGLGNYRPISQATGIIGIGGTNTLTIVWPLKFASTNYSISCSADVDGIKITSIGSITVSSIQVAAHNTLGTTVSGNVTCRGKENI